MSKNTPLWEVHQGSTTRCDRCDVELPWRGIVGDRHSLTLRAACCEFVCTVCHRCFKAIQKRGHAERRSAWNLCRVRRAARYSPAFRDFTAEWLGVRLNRVQIAKLGGPAR